MSTHHFEPPRPPSEPRTRRATRLGALIAAALALHVAVLGGADWLWPSAAPPPLPADSLEVRVVEPAPRAVIGPIATPPQPLPPSPPRTKGVSKPLVAAQPAAVAQPPAALPVVERVPAARVDSVSSSADEETIPPYRTQLPPAAALRYEVSRGALHGTGDLVWRPQGERYELKLDFRLGGVPILSQSSMGGLDPSGIAPLRFTDQRARRGATAANFQREAGKITYSGSPSAFTLKPGAQDRLSWMLQLAAIVSAEPQLTAPGARVVMQVTGSRGDAGLWVFRCLGSESVDARGGAVEALGYLREPREAYDTTVRVGSIRSGTTCRSGPRRSRARTTKGTSCDCSRWARRVDPRIE